MKENGNEGEQFPEERKVCRRKCKKAQGEPEGVEGDKSEPQNRRQRRSRRRGRRRGIIVEGNPGGKMEKISDGRRIYRRVRHRIQWKRRRRKALTIMTLTSIAAILIMANND